MSRRGSITTNIEALASCKHTFAVIMQSGVSSKSVGPVTDTLVTLASSSQLELEHDIDSLALHISMYDVDRLPIEHSEPDLNLLWGPAAGHRTKVLYRRSELGAHVFQASVPQEWRSTAGSYLLSAHINQGWDEQAQGRSDCLISEFSINVRCSKGYIEDGSSGQCKPDRSAMDTPQRIVEIVVPIIACVILLLLGLQCWYLKSKVTLGRRLADERAKTLARLWARFTSGKAASLSAFDETNAYGDLPIHCVAAGCPPLGLLNELLQGFPAGASSPDRLGNLPLHLMVRSLRDSNEPVESVNPIFEALLAAYPKAAITPGEHQKLPIELLVEANYSSPGKARLYVLLGFPYSADGLADNWCSLLMHPTEKDGEEAVEAIVQEAKRNRVVSIEQLASAKDSLDREAYAVATKHKRRYLNTHLLLLGRSKSIRFALVWRSPLSLV